MKAWLVLFLMCLTFSAYAEIYRWVDDKGRVHFSDEPSKKHQTESVEVKINTYENVTVEFTPFDPGRDKSGAKKGSDVFSRVVWCL